GASRPAEFPAETARFLADQLPRLVEALQLEELRRLEGTWPEYPQRLHQLARQNRFAIPGLSLPGPRDLWDDARAHLPDVPDQILHRFALTQLSSEERRRMGISLSDP